MKPKCGLVKRAGKALKKTSPTILTCLGAVGVVATAVLAVKATPKALKCIEAATDEKMAENSEKLTRMETIGACWTCYAPAAITGIATIGCIFGANVLNRRQQAALTSAYALLNRTYQDYKHSVKNVFGEEGHQRVLQDMAIQKVSDDHVIYAPGLVTSVCSDFEDAVEERRVFYDRVSERYFESTISKVLEAEMHLNRNLAQFGENSLNKFYELLGIDPIPEGDTIGWYIDDEAVNNEEFFVLFSHPHTLIDDGPMREPVDCWIIDPCLDPRAPVNW